MTITGIIDRIGEPRTFVLPAATGGKRTMTAREITIRSGNNTFIADAYDRVAEYLDDPNVAESVPYIVELRFDERLVKTKDGNVFSQQQVTVVTVQPLYNFITPKAF